MRRLDAYSTSQDTRRHSRVDQCGGIPIIHHPRTQEVEAGGLRFNASLGSIPRPCPKSAKVREHISEKTHSKKHILSSFSLEKGIVVVIEEVWVGEVLYIYIYDLLDAF